MIATDINGLPLPPVTIPADNLMIAMVAIACAIVAALVMHIINNPPDKRHHDRPPPPSFPLFPPF